MPDSDNRDYFYGNKWQMADGPETNEETELLKKAIRLVFTPPVWDQVEKDAALSPSFRQEIIDQAITILENRRLNK